MIMMLHARAPAFSTVVSVQYNNCSCAAAGFSLRAACSNMALWLDMDRVVHSLVQHADEPETTDVLHKAYLTSGAPCSVRCFATAASKVLST